MSARERLVAVSRNVIMLRTLEWMVTRRANRLLLGEAAPMLRAQDGAVVRQLMLEAATGILAAPTRLKEMGERARAVAVPDAAERIVSLLLEMASLRPRPRRREARETP